jgi:hypothetical protein
MVDNRAAGYFGIGGAFNFKSGDISGTAARTQDDKMGQGGEYFAQQQQEEFEEEQNESKYMDRSAVLRATLNSLAMMNVANVINSRKIEAKKQKDLLATQQLLKKKHEESLHGSINSSEDVNLKSSSEDEVEDIVD